MSSQYVVPPQDKLMNEKIGYDGDNDLANFSKFLAAPYANAPVHNSASYFTPNSIRINENSERCANGNTHDSASYVADNSSRINKIQQGTYSQILLNWKKKYWSLKE